MPSYRLDGFKFDRSNIAGVDADCVRGLNSYLTSREAAINTVQTETYICAGGPFDGQPIELEQPAGDMHAHAGQPGARTADLAFGKWCGFYQVIKGDKGGLAAVWHEAGAPAVVGDVAFFGKQRAPAKQAKTPTLGRGFARLGEFIASLSDAQEGETAQFSIGRTTYRIPNNAESIARLRSRVIKAKRWFADKYIIEPKKAAQAAECEDLQQTQHAAAAVADVVNQAAAGAFVAGIVASAADQAQTREDQAAECVAMACADESRPMASAAGDRGATLAPGGRGAGHAGPSSSNAGAVPLPGHAYHGKTSAQLRYIISDAGEAARNMRGMDPAAECKYLDQVNDACTVLHHRGETGQAPTFAPTLAQAAAIVDNQAPADAPAEPAAYTPADPGPAATMPPAIGASQAPDYSDGRKTSSALHDTPQDLDPGAGIPPAVDLDALDLDTLSTAAAQALIPEKFNAIYDALEHVNHHNGALQLRALRAGNKAIANQVAAIERECIKAGHLTPELELRRRALSALVRHIEQQHLEACAPHGIAPGGSIAPKITAKHIHHHIRTTPGNSIGSVEMLAGVDICSQMERTALWSKFRHLYAGDSQTLIDAVMAECYKRAARLVNDGALCLWRPRI